ncbi:MAG: hypothetical protein HQL55_12880 [Magnetococcales bacterium]|nr:hypothetical protein [Magnetococcales bacterium]
MPVVWKGECGRIAEQCQAKGVVLSHFYPIPAHDEARRQECARYYGGRIYLAEDLDVYEWQGERFQPVNKQSTWDNIQLMAREFRKSRIILAAHNLGIFATLAQGRVTAQQLAQKRNLSLRGCRLLLDSLTSLGVIHKEGETYLNTLTSNLHLHEAGEQSMINIMGHIAHMERSWMGLEEAVQSGEPVHLPDQGLIHNQERNQIFIGAMAEMGRGWARQIVKIIDFSNCHSLLDLGGGPGVYAMEFMAENPQLNGVLIDLPITLASAVPFIQQSPVAHRLTCKGVDFYQPDADIGQGYDAVLISNVLHVEGEEANRLLLKKVYDAMLPGGILLLHETIINPDRISPQERALFAVNMLVHTQRGNCYTFEEMAGWLTEAGFVRILLEPRMVPPSLIVAYKD